MIFLWTRCFFSIKYPFSFWKSLISCIYLFVLGEPHDLCVWMNRSVLKWLFQVTCIVCTQCVCGQILQSGLVWERVNWDTKPQLLCEWVLCIISATQWRRWVTMNPNQAVKTHLQDTYKHSHIPTAVLSFRNSHTHMHSHRVCANFILHSDIIVLTLWYIMILHSAWLIVGCLRQIPISLF